MLQAVGCVDRLVKGACIVRQGSLQACANTLSGLLRPMCDTTALPQRGDTTTEDYGNLILDLDKATPNATPRRWFAWLK